MRHICRLLVASESYKSACEPAVGDSVVNTEHPPADPPIHPVGRLRPETARVEGRGPPQWGSAPLTGQVVGSWCSEPLTHLYGL